MLVSSHWARLRPRQIARLIKMAYIELNEGVHTAPRQYQWCHWPRHFTGLVIGLGVVQCDHTILISMRAVLRQSSQHWLCVDADAWCKQALIGEENRTCVSRSTRRSGVTNISTPIVWCAPTSSISLVCGLNTKSLQTQQRNIRRKGIAILEFSCREVCSTWKQVGRNTIQLIWDSGKIHKNLTYYKCWWMLPAHTCTHYWSRFPLVSTIRLTFLLPAFPSHRPWAGQSGQSTSVTWRTERHVLLNRIVCRQHLSKESYFVTDSRECLLTQ